MFNIKRILLLVVVILVLAGVVVWAKKMDEKTGYSVVHFITGEVYIGKLKTFPDFVLEDSYILEIVKDPADSTKSNFQLSPIDEALWATRSLHMVRSNVVFYAPILSGSKIAQSLKAKGK